MMELKVFVTTDCWTCHESRKIAADVAEQFPHLHVEVVELDEGGERPTAVFAVPTYTLNGKVISLGNPLWDDLYHKLEIQGQNQIRLGTQSSGQSS